jgi:hypothetical protein
MCGYPRMQSFEIGKEPINQVSSDRTSPCKGKNINRELKLYPEAYRGASERYQAISGCLIATMHDDPIESDLGVRERLASSLSGIAGHFQIRGDTEQVSSDASSLYEFRIGSTGNCRNVRASV